MLRKRLPWIPLLGFFALAASSAWTTPSASADEPDGPFSPAIVRPPFDPDQGRKTAEFWARRAERDPSGYIEYRELAGAYLALQRQTGEIGYAVLAEKAARHSLKITSRNNASALNRLAQALLGQHRFPEALETANLALAYDPDAQRFRADVLLELGDYSAAEDALAKVEDRPDDLNLMALQARFAELHGQNDKALDLMRSGGRLADSLPDMPAEAVAWYHAMTGHRLIDTGRLDDGELACKKALAIFPNDYRALTGLAEAATWRRDWNAAADWALKALDAGPENPEALRLLGEAYDAMGQHDDANQQYQRLETLAHSFPRIYDRHWALFLADHGRDLDEALRIARADLELRHDVHAYDTLAWVCFKNGLLDEASSSMKKALAQGTREAPLFQHAASIARATGDSARAEKYDATAQSLNPSLKAPKPVCSPNPESDSH